jgi:L-ascorbate metabolism protein UlaG (beta-lactamase superfamily)
VISHSHWDHLADTHAIAKHTGAKVIGSETTCNICASFNVSEEQMIRAEAFSKITCDDLVITFYPSLHMVRSGGDIPFPGIYKSPSTTPPTRACDYLEGNTFAVLLEFDEMRILNIGSANVIEEHLLEAKPTVLILSTAGWERTHRFIERVTEATRPKMVIPVHFDTMEGPVEHGVTDRDPAAMERFQHAMKKVAPSIEVRRLDYFEKLMLMP